MGRIELIGLRVERGEQVVVRDLDLVVEHGERLVLLGPSGVGKTTLLRTLAGLDPVAAGRIEIDGSDVTALAPRERDVAMVDQNSTLQPHLDVGDNVGFPLRVRHVGEHEVGERIHAEARAFGFMDRLRRRPRTLSAGERDDVAMSRALVRRVGVLLLDEPFAHHDAPRTSELVRALIETQQGYDVTMVMASNDQRIAMSLADRCAVLHEGRVVQIAPPQELFARPADVFVAGFVGSPPMNLLPGRIERGRSGARIVAGPLRIRSFAPEVSALVDQAVTVGVRPTDLHLAAVAGSPPRGGIVEIEEVVRDVSFAGSSTEVRFGDAAAPSLALLGRDVPAVGALIRLTADPAHIHVFDADGRAVAHGV